MIRVPLLGLRERIARIEAALLSGPLYLDVRQVLQNVFWEKVASGGLCNVHRG
jgi:hypothetical protein